MGILGSMTVNFNANVTNFQNGIKTVTTNLSGFAKNTQQGAGVVLGAFALAGIAVAGFGALSVKAAADFQQSMLKVQAYAGLSKTQMDSMTQSILDMSAKVGQSPKALADAIYPIISSGYGAADALNILKLSAETAAASGAKTSVVADALTTSLGAMHAPASQAGHYMDMFNKIVSLGKGEVPQYAAVIGKLSLAASGAGIDFGTMGAALADLTTHGFPSVAQASTALGSLFTQVGVKTDAMAQHAKAAGIAFDAHKFATLDLTGKLNYLQQVTGGNQGELLKLIGGSTLALKAFNALEGGSKDLASNLSAMKNSAGATDSAFKTASSGLNATMARAGAAVDVLQVKIGTALLPVITSLVDKVAPAITSFLDWANKNHIVENAVNGVTAAINGIGVAMNFIIPIVSNVVHFFQQHHAAMVALQAILVPVAGVLGGLLVAALVSVAIAAWAAVAPFLVFAAPFILIGAIVAVVIAGIVLAIMHWGAIVKWFQGIWGAVSSWFMGIVHAVGAFFISVWSGLAAWFTGMWTGIIAGLQAAWAFIINVVKVGILVVLAVLFAPILIIAGLFIWLYQHNTYFKMFVDAIVGFFVGCFNWCVSHWQGFVNFLGGLWNGAVNLAHSAWSAVNGAIMGVIMFVLGWIGSQWNATIGVLGALWGLLSGLAALAWKGVVIQFQNAWGMISSALNSLWNNLKNWFDGWPSQWAQFAINAVEGFIRGIISKIGDVGKAALQIAQKFASFLGFHSPTKEGPGQEADQWAPNFVKMYASGLEAGIPKIQAAMQKLAAPAMLNLKVGAGSYPSGTSNNSSAILAAVASSASSSGNNNQNAEFHIYIDGKEVTSKLGPHIANAIRAKGVRSR